MDFDMKRPEQAPRKRDKYPWVAAVVAGGVMLSWGLVRGSGSAGGGLAYLSGAAVGAALVQACLVGLLLWVIAFRGNRDHGMGLAFLCLFLVGVPANIVGAMGQIGNQRVAIAGMAEALEQAISGEKVTTRSQATGEAGVAEALSRQYLSDVQADTAAFETNLTRTVGDGLFVAEALAADPQLLETTRKTVEMRRLIADQRARSERRIEELLQAVDASTLSPAARAEFKASIRRGAEAVKPTMDEWWVVEEEIMTEMEQTTAFLKASRRHWRVEGDQLMFTSDAHLARLNRHMSRLDAVEKREAEVKARMNAVRAERLAEMKAMS